jgi:hypothetical protein
MHNGDLEREMLKQRSTLDNTCSNQFQVRVKVHKVKSHFIQSARDLIAEHYDLGHFEFDAERLEFSDSVLADNMHFAPVAEGVEGGVHGPNPMQRVSEAANQWPPSTWLPGGSNSEVYLQTTLSSGE